MRLRTKFLTSIGTVLILSFGFTFYRMSKFQDELVISQARQQAQILAQQVILTRKWVADHHGVYLEKKPGIEGSPFLESPVVFDQNKKEYVKYNPARVTRELSEYANNFDLWRFKVTSLNPVNPANYPDSFETKGLAKFANGDDKITSIENSLDGRVLRFMIPLMTEESCLECHSRHGYKVGDVRGGLSLTIPMKNADIAIAKNNRMLLSFALMAILLTILVLYMLIDFIVVRKVKILSNHMIRFPEEGSSPEMLPLGGDEIGELSAKFQNLGKRLTESQDELEKTREQIYQSEKLAALGRFSAGVAHEINNPLGGMLNCVKSIKEAPNDEDLRNRYIDLIEKGLKRIETTSRQLLNFGRKEPLQLKEVDVDALIKECFSLMTYNLKEISFDYDLALKRPVAIDVEALTQVIINIGLNAIQAISERGSIQVHSYENGSGIVITISDDGVGIEDENIRKIFDPFFTTKDISEGTGLGLSVTYAQVQRMDGNIRVTSKKNEGSCFQIELPRK
ncbi:MAG: DUF3365 domain-containing protein [Proteobacteria bacterium]|nr:DUF3365 domain-containing protein [Pseudomonadota bacterium]